MMISSHLLASLLLGIALSQWRRFTPRDWALAVGFGVAIDLDHLLQLRQYILSHGGLRGMHAATIVHWGASWQGFMHTPLALALVVPACLLFRTLVPAAFWGLHMFQDFVIARSYVVFGSPEEMVIDVALLALVIAGFWLDRRRQGAADPLPRYVAGLFGWRPDGKAATAPPEAAGPTEAP